MQLLYLKTVTLVERLHRRLLDVIKDEFDRSNVADLNPVQALLLYNIGEQEVQPESCGRGGIIWGQMFPTISRSWSSWDTSTTSRLVPIADRFILS